MRLIWTRKPRKVYPLAAIFPLLRMVDPFVRFCTVHLNLAVKNRGTRGIRMISGTSEKFDGVDIKFEKSSGLQ